MKNHLLAAALITLALFALSGCGKVGSATQGASPRQAGHTPKPAPPPAPPAFKAFKPNPEEVVAVLPDAIGPVAFAGDGRTIVACKKGDAPALVLWDVSAAEPKVTAELPGHTKLIWALAFSPDGKTLASCSIDETIRLWDFADGKAKLRTVIAWHKGQIDSLAWSRDAKTLACSGGDDKQGGENWHVTLWDVSTAKPREIRTFNGGTPMALSPDGKKVAAGWAVDIRLWDISRAESEEPATLHGHSGTITALAFSPDGKCLVSVSKDRTVRLWDVTSEDERNVGEAHRGPVTSLAWAPNGKLFATAGETDPGRIVLWDATGKKLKEWSVPQNDIYGGSVAFSADSTKLAFPVLGEYSTRLVYVLRAAP